MAADATRRNYALPTTVATRLRGMGNLADKWALCDISLHFLHKLEKRIGIIYFITLISNIYENNHFRLLKVVILFFIFLGQFLYHCLI